MIGSGDHGKQRFCDRNSLITSENMTGVTEKKEGITDPFFNLLNAAFTNQQSPLVLDT